MASQKRKRSVTAMEEKKVINSPLRLPIIPTFVADLTPTPTRFLRSCEESGLFNDISRNNPFDADFKRESSESHNTSHLHSSQQSQQPRMPSSRMQSVPIPSVILDSIADDNDAEDVVTETHLQDEEIEDENDDNQQSEMMYDVTQENETNAMEEEAEPPEKQLIQVLLQLPGGAFLPLNIPADALAHATFPQFPVLQAAPAAVQTPVVQMQAAAPVAPIHIVPSPEPASSVSGPITSSTKQKLKAAVQQKKTLLFHDQSKRGGVEPVLLRQRSLEHTAQRGVSSRQDGASVSKVTKLAGYQSVQMPAVDTSYQLVSASSEDDDNEEKRKRFLESNRAAANRCRQKKKVWINGLEEKTKGLQDVNRSLTAETAKLRIEISHLKHKLSLHKDCGGGSTVMIFPANETEKNF